MTNVHLAVVINGYCHAIMCELVKDKGAGMLQSMRSQRVGHHLATEQQETKL